MKDSGIALEMDEAASLAKQKSDLEDEYMYFSDILEDEKEEARAEGHAEGLEAGRRQQKIESAKNLLRSNMMKPDQIAQILDMSLEEVTQVSKELES